MRGWQRRMRHLGIALVLFGCLATGARADALYSVTSLGPANPSQSFLTGSTMAVPGTNVPDPSGNYLPELSPADRAAFQSGSFDVFAHPGSAYYASNPVPDETRLGGGIQSSQEYNNWALTGNNLGDYAGTSSIDGRQSEQFHLLMYTPDPHVVYPNDDVYPPVDQSFQATGTLSVVSTNDDAKYGSFYGTVSGLNDKGVMLVNEWNRVGPNGQLVWNPYVQSVNLQAFGSGTVSLGSLGGPYGFANALNNSNEIVGWSQIASGAQHAFLYMNGTMQDLNLMIPASSGVTLIDAVGIDAAGRIVAYGTDASGQTEEYLLTPQIVPAPEPSTLVVFGVAILTVAASRHRSRRNVTS